MVEAGSPGGSDDEESLVSLPLFVLPTCLHPGQSGVIRVFEPRYVALFRDQQRRHLEAALAAPPAPGPGPGPAPPPPLRAAPDRAAAPRLRFGHILSPGAAPPALLEGSVGGLPAVGVYARVTHLEEAAGGAELTVHYEGVRRFKLLAVDDRGAPYPLAAVQCFKLLAVDDRGAPYPLAAVQWYDDDTPSLPLPAREAISSLEVDVLRTLCEIQRLSARLGAAGGGAGGGGAQLPPEVARHAPPPPAARGSTADYLRAAGVPAGEAIATWQRHGSVYGRPAERKRSAADPYEHLREKIAKEHRQELFSFAAANCLELGLAERLALLLSRDTAARLGYVLYAARPHLSDLAARAAVESAVGGGGGGA
ncbi:MAG: hypothetical protein J3K34DRAFT_466748 [Monoraphidium minutum]|nr:MAG: hypothetical protein J3K34DRAFT_466748 [Monoraphidium minutum]